MRIFKLLKSNIFAVYVLRLMTGTGLAQFITFIFSPLLTRIYNPSQFGLFFLFVISAGLFSIIQTGALEKAIIVGKSRIEALSIFSLVIVIICGIDLFMIALYPIFSVILDFFFHYNLSFVFYIVFLLYASILALIRLFSATLNRRKKYSIIATAIIVKASAILFFQISFGLLGWIRYGLVTGSVIGLVVSSIYLLYFTPINLRYLRINYLWEAKVYITKRRDFVLFEMPASIINELSVQLPVYVLKFFYGQTSTGLFSLTHKVLSQPMQILGHSVAEVFIRKASEMEHQNISQEKLAFDVFKTLFKLGIVPFTIIALWGPFLFSFIFSDAWRISGIVASILAPWQLLVLAGSPVSSIFITKGKLKLSYQLNIFLLTTRAVSLLAGVFFFNDFIITVSLFSLVSCLYWLFLSFYSLKICGISYNESIWFVVKWSFIPIVLFVIKYFL